ncbi:MAG: hypothetical protein V1696_01050 [Candidatus Jorgensenbacteria bacterium]
MDAAFGSWLASLTLRRSEQTLNGLHAVPTDAFQNKVKAPHCGAL